MENYIFFVVDKQPLFNDRGDVCIQNISDGSIHFTTITDELLQLLKEHFPNINIPSRVVEDESSCSNNSNDVTNSTNSTSEKHWSRAATLCLIEVWKQFEEKFKSTTIKNDQVWKMVAQKLQLQGFCYNHVQCRDKWQYMKKRYIKKCDNAGPRGTGEERMNFEFYQELHEIFQKKHNVDPPAVASSLKGLNSSVSEDTLNTINMGISKQNYRYSTSNTFHRVNIGY